MGGVFTKGLPELDEKAALNRRVAKMLGCEEWFDTSIRDDQRGWKIVGTDGVSMTGTSGYETSEEAWKAFLWLRNWASDLNWAWDLQYQYPIEGVTLIDLAWLQLPANEAAEQMVRAWLRWKEKDK